MNSQEILSRIVFFNTDTRHARLTEQACRMPSFYFAYFLFGSDRFLLWPRTLERQSNAQCAQHIRNVIGDSMS